MNPNSPPSREILLSSQLGRQWLEASNARTVIDHPDSDATEQNDCVDQSPQPDTDPHSDSADTIFVSIPDLTSGIQTPGGDLSTSGSPAEFARQLAKASEQRLKHLGGTGANSEERTEPDPQTADTRTKQTTPSSPAIYRNPNSMRSDLAEPPTEWTDQPSPLESPRKDSGKPPSKPDQDPAINKLATAIQDRFPGDSPTVLLFVGSEENRHTDETCARVAAALAQGCQSQVLLLDSDCVGHAISNASGMAGKSGITDVVNSGIKWESTVCGRSGTGLDFIPSGTGIFHQPTAGERVRSVVAEMKQKYRYICIAAGDAHSQSARLWSEVCDGTYLLVSLKDSNQTIAKSAVAELQSIGARLLGCVVTDVD